MAWEAISAEQVAKICGVSPSSLQEEWYDMAVSLIERHAGIFNPGKIVPVDELINGSGMRYQRVTRPPIASVDAVYIDGNIVPPNMYVSTDTSIVMVDDYTSIHPHIPTSVFPEGSKNIRVVYTSGDETDYAVAMAIALIVKEMSSLSTKEGAEAHLMTFRPGESVATEEPLVQWGMHGKIKGIITTLLGRKFKAA